MSFHILWLPFFSLYSLTAAAPPTTTTASSHTTPLHQGLHYHQRGDYQLALDHYNSGIAFNKNCSDCFHLSGLVHLVLSNMDNAIASIRTAIELNPIVDNYHNSLGEVYRQTDRPQLAAPHYQEAIRISLMKNRPNSEYHNNAGLVFMQMGDSTTAAGHFRRAMEIKPFHTSANHNLGLALRNIGQLEESILVLQSLRERAPNDVDATFHLAISLQMSGALTEAGILYSEILSIQKEDQTSETNRTNEDDDDWRTSAIQVNLGAIYQESGDFQAAINLYTQVLAKKPSDPRALNNLGSSLWQLGDAEGSVDAYTRAIASDDSSPEPYVNLGVALYEYGDVAGAKEKYEQALALGGSEGLRVRIAMLMKPIMLSNKNVLRVRERFEAEIQILQRMTNPKFQINEPVKDIERLHFYLVYHGFNEYANQVMMARLYLSSVSHLRWLSPLLPASIFHKHSSALKHHSRENSPPQRANSSSKKKIRVGFVSKFFVVNHAHGQLLEGIVAHLPRDSFEIIICAIPNPQQSLLPSISQTADHISHLSFNMKEARQQMSNLKMDVLIFADMMSEPLTYFLGLGSRIAPVQCLFWGNPVTSGGENIDYFISGEHMEPEPSDPASDETQYSEQVVRLKGQGIWYDQVPVPPPRDDRRKNIHFDLNSGRSDEDQDDNEAWLWQRADPSIIVYICPQSSFKLHPDFDKALADVLSRVKNGHLVLLQGRRDTWTSMVQQRMRESMPTDVWKRIHFVPRVAGSDAFIQLLQRADVMLHPFPFGGSKTSADALAAGLPLVIKVGKHLRGRMAYSYFVTMDYFETVARTTIEYVNIAVRLGVDKEFRMSVVQAVRERSPLIWERMTVVDAWANFLDRAHRTHVSNIESTWVMSSKRAKHDDAAHVIVVSNSRRRQNFSVAPPAPPPVAPVAKHVSPSASIIKKLLQSARLYYESGDVINAQRLYEKVLVLTPNDPGILNDFGAVLKQSNQLEKAREMFLKASQAQPGYMIAHNNLGVVLQELGLYQEASREYLKVLDISPSHSGAVYNLGNLFRDLGREDHAVDMLKKSLRLEYHGFEVVCLLSLLDVTEMRVTEWRDLNERLASNVSTSINLLEEVHRLQHSYLDSCNSLVKFLTHLKGHAFVRQSQDVYEIFRRSKETVATRKEEQARGVVIRAEEFHVIVQWHRASSPERQAEINACLNKNLALSFVTHIHVLTEKKINFDSFVQKNYLKKLTQIVIGKRLTFEYAFQYASEHLSGLVCSVTNADIFFDSTVEIAILKLKNNTVYASLRWESGPLLLPRIDSQDVWTFRSPIQVQGADFELGRLRSDNRLGAQLLESNYRVINNPFDLKVHHLQASNKRPGRTNEEQIPGRTSNIVLHVGF